jgi:hypothetical protein
MDTAGRIAARYSADERLRRLCPIVVPVAGLLAAAGATLREDEFAALARIAGLAVDDVVDLLLTADRLVDPGAAVEIEPARRRRLLDRLGLFGVRLAVRLIRDGSVGSADELARELTARSGLHRLRDTLAAQFVGRTQVLKARSALAALDSVLRAGPSAVAPELAAEAERIRASAHEFVEVRLVHLLRSGRLPGPADQLVQMERLLGGLGSAAATRLGLPPDAPAELLESTAARELTRWQRLAEHPMWSRELRMAARATARSCEGVLADLHTPRPA